MRLSVVIRSKISSLFLNIVSERLATMSATTMKVGDRVEVVGKDVQGKVGLDILLEARLCREQNP